MSDNYPYNKPFPQDKWLDEAMRLRHELEKVERSLSAYSMWIGRTPTERELIVLAKFNAENIRAALEVKP